MTRFRLCRPLFSILFAVVGFAGLHAQSEAEALPPEHVLPAQAPNQDNVPTETATMNNEPSTLSKLTAFTSHASQLAMQAVSTLGIHYKYGGNSPENGLDCSGLVRYVFKEALGKDLPRTSAEISHFGQRVDPHELRPGDLVFYNTLRRGFSHVGIYLGDNKFIHSPSAGGRVRIESMDLSYWKRRFNGARRIDDPESSGSTQ